MIGRVQLGFAGTKMQFSNFPLEFYFHPYSWCFTEALR